MKIMSKIKEHFKNVTNGYLTYPSVLINGEKVIRESDIEFLIESFINSFSKKEANPEMIKIDTSHLSKVNLEKLEKNWIAYLESISKDSVPFIKANKKCLPDYAGTFRTYSGKTINILEPTPDMIELRDIAKGLGYNAHFSGQSPEFFSIAEHCLLTEELVKKEYPKDYELRLIALLHDAAEAYIGDMIHPIKVLFPEFKAMENKLLSVIFEKFNLPYYRLSEVKPFDLQAQDIEAIAFYQRPRKEIRYYNPDYAVDYFSDIAENLLMLIKNNPRTIVICP